MKNNLKQSNLPFLLLISVIIKSLFISEPIFDSFAITALSCLFGFKLWLDHVKKPDHNQMLNEKIDKHKDDTQKQFEDLFKKVSSIGANLALHQKKPNQQQNAYKW